METFRILIVAAFSLYCSAYANHCNVHVVLLGATGDLARRYLWSAIFDNYVTQLLNTTDSGYKLVSITASSREPASKGDDILAALANTLKCPETIKTSEQCNALKAQFSEIVTYHRLKSEDDYVLLAMKHQAIDDGCTTCTTTGKLFYLSIPPHAYSGITNHIHTHLRPKGSGSMTSWIRVIFEKPFGSDLNSAMILHSELGEYLQENEIYRVDHYLGKNGVKQILSFRQQNKEQLDSFWNSKHIDHIDVVINEKNNCNGRTKFYDQYGVIRDVFQNHLTEMVTLVAMELLTNEDTSKMMFLESLFPPRLYNAVLGQYDNYISHLVSDGVKQNVQNVSHTPTYASVVLFSKAPRWNGVPFFLTSGKALGRKSSYIRIVFKSSLTSSQYLTDSTCNPEIVFVIQDDHFEMPGILLSKYFADLISVTNGKGWKKNIVDTTDFTCGPYVYLNAETNPYSNNAYTDILSSALCGDKDKFVSTDRLFALWKIWSPLLEEIDVVSPYVQLYSENMPEVLSYKRIGSKLYFVHKLSSMEKSEEFSGMVQSNVTLGNKFALADKLTLKFKYLVSQAAGNGQMFHMALPGGTSPELFYQNMVMDCINVPWDFIHIWQVDERCVPYYSTHSNLHAMDMKFLQLVPISRSHIHPMVDHYGNCHNADINYQTELSQHTVMFDLVVLGLGRDGHIASLFPNTHYNDSEDLVSYVKLRESYLVEIRERITITFRTILQGKHVVVLAVDDDKCDVVKMLLNGKGSHLPTAKLLHQPNVFWYINQNCVVYDENMNNV